MDSHVVRRLTSFIDSSSSIGLTLCPIIASPPDPYLLRQTLKSNPIAFYNNLDPIAPNHVHLLRYNDRQMLTNNIHDQLQSTYRYQNGYDVDLEMEMEMERDRERDQDLDFAFDQSENNGATINLNDSNYHLNDAELYQNNNIYAAQKESRQQRGGREEILNAGKNLREGLNYNDDGAFADSNDRDMIRKGLGSSKSGSQRIREGESCDSHLLPLHKALNLKLIEKHQKRMNSDILADNDGVRLASVPKPIPKANDKQDVTTNGGFSLSTFLRNSVQVHTPKVSLILNTCSYVNSGV